ncbi:MAG: ribonuclease P protein component [Cyclobacteriaceae bacterium]
MKENNASKKLHSLSKNERLCNFTYKKMLFDQGESFHLYPLRVFWKLIDSIPEQILFENSVTQFAGDRGKKSSIRSQQNPSYPYKALPHNALFQSPVKVLTGASSKTHRSAVARNKLKRMLREGYRKNKHIVYSLLNESGRYLLLGFIYTAPRVLDCHEIEKKIIVSLQKLVMHIEDQTGMRD